MKIAYFDCFAGASGDMILGALLDARLKLTDLAISLAKLRLPGYRLSTEPTTRGSIAGTRAHVSLTSDRPRVHRHLGDIRDIIEKSDLDGAVKQRSIAVFQRLAEAEARVHAIGVEEVHFHEVGAVDAIVDIVGAAAGLHLLGIEKVYASPLHLGSGTVQCEHGTLPVPAPATAELVRGVPVYATDVKGELLTPTGAAILTTVAEGFGPMPGMVVERIGYGAGAADREIPNLLRLSIGHTQSRHVEHDVGAVPACLPTEGYDGDEVTVLECAIDDMNPQIFGYLSEMLLAEGALDVYTTPVFMKKNRPGTLLTVIAAPESHRGMAAIIMKETTTIGLRVRAESRLKASREIRTVSTPWGEARVKVARRGNAIVNISPEYEDCRGIAEREGLPLKRVMDAVKAAGTAMVERRGGD